MGAGVIMQYALDHPALSLTLESPVSPYGFGGTRRDGSRLTDDDAGTGGGAANPDFVQRLIDGDTTDEAPTSPRSVFRSGYVAAGLHHRARGRLGRVDAHDLDGDRATTPATPCPSENWPGFAAGTIGVLNTMAPQVLRRVGIVDLADEARRSSGSTERSTRSSRTRRSTTSTTSASSGSFPAGPGADVAPPQEMVSQTRDVLDAYAAAGGERDRVRARGHRPHAAPRAPRRVPPRAARGDRVRRARRRTPLRRPRPSSSSPRTDRRRAVRRGPRRP